MGLYALSDLHLSSVNDKPMDIFDIIWKNHSEKIYQNWNSIINENDYVLVPGDLTWGKNLIEAKPDLDFISNLHGFKILFQGNHDYFWNSTQKLNEMYNNMYFVKNSYFKYENMAICGTRGWVCPNDSMFTEHDKKIYLREAGRLRNSIEKALNDNYDNIIVCLHFPPTNDKKENSLFIDIIKEYNVKTVIYGHLHGVNSFYSSYQGNVDGVNYSLVSADFLNFKPIKIL
ncbi:MAG: metallophosphoesterase [Lachnospirales bacterium]